jgi:predicted Zn-dependent protease
MRIQSGILAALIAVALASDGCVVNPVTGETEFSVLSPQNEAEIGRETAAQVEATMGLVEDPALIAYVRLLGSRIARHSPRQDVTYQFFIADDPTPNAFALPGAYVYVTRGLLAYTNSEAELAGVIGHEIGHVAARHAAQRQTRALGVGLLSVLGTIAGGALGGESGARTAAQIGQVAGAGYIASYSRDQERQADEVGQRISADTGYAPDGITRFLRTLQREEQLRTGRERIPGFLDSHPLTGERVQATEARARTLQVTPQPPLSRDDASFLARLEGLLVGPDPAQGVFVEGRFLHPDFQFAIDFPSGWQTQNQPQVVLAAPEGGEAVVQLQMQGPPGDPVRAAKEFLEHNGIQAQQARSSRIGGFEAHRVRAQVATQQQGTLGLDLTWIAHPRGIFRVMGAAPASRFNAYAERFAAVAQSFRTLDARERAQIRELRLRVVPAGRGETLDALSRRSANRWTIEETAVANGVDAAVRLTAGTRVKVAVERPYRP